MKRTLSQAVRRMWWSRGATRSRLKRSLLRSHRVEAQLPLRKVIPSSFFCFSSCSSFRHVVSRNPALVCHPELATLSSRTNVRDPGFVFCIVFLYLNSWFRPAGELLFCLQQQKSNQKNAAPGSLTPGKAPGVPSSRRGCSAAAELTHTKRSLRQSSRTTSEQPLRSSVSENGGGKSKSKP